MGVAKIPGYAMICAAGMFRRTLGDINMPQLNIEIEWSDLDSPASELVDHLIENYRIDEIVDALTSSSDDILSVLDYSLEDYVRETGSVEEWIETLDDHYGRDVFKTALAELSSDLAENNEDSVYKFIHDCSDMNTLLMIINEVIRRLLTGECQI